MNVIWIFAFGLVIGLVIGLLAVLIYIVESVKKYEKENEA